MHRSIQSLIFIFIISCNFSAFAQTDLNTVVFDIREYLDEYKIDYKGKKTESLIIQNILKGFIGVTYLNDADSQVLSQQLDQYMDLAAKLAEFAPNKVVSVEQWGIDQLNDIFKRENARLTKELLVFMSESEIVKALGIDSFKNMLKSYAKSMAQKLKDHIDLEIRPQLKTIGTLLFTGDSVRIATEQDRKFELFIETLLNEYYTDIPDKWIANAAMGIMAMGPVEVKMVDVIKVLLKNSGPIFGKTLQMIARDHRFSDKLTHLISIIEDAGKAVPRSIVLDSIKDDGGAYKIKELGSKQFSGTVAYTQEAYLSSGDHVALRAIKPGMKEMLETELIVYKRVLDAFSKLPELKSGELPDLDKIVQMLESLVIEDLNITKARLNHQEMFNYYREQINLDIPELKKITMKLPRYYPPINNMSTQFQVSEFITNGKKLGQFVEVTSATISSEVAMNLAKFWYNKTFVDSKMKFHADLHQGNFTIIKKSDSAIEVVFFDSGLIGEATKSHLKAFLKISLGIKFKSTRLLIKGFNETLTNKLSKKSPEFKELRANVESQLAKRQIMIDKGISDGPMKLGEWVGWLVQSGYDVDDKMNMLARGQVMINQALNEAGGKSLQLQGQKELVRLLGKNMLWKTSFLLPSLASSLWTTAIDRCSHFFGIGRGKY